MKITIDFETRSAIDIKTAGPWKYADHYSTDIICLAIKAGKRPAKLWLPPWVKEKLSEEFIEKHVVGDDQILSVLKYPIEAHNLEFERAVWRHVMHEKYGFPDLKLEQCSCSAAKAAVHSLPRALEKAAKVTNLPVTKDMTGHRIMLKLCKPRVPNKEEKKEIKELGVEVIDNKAYVHPEKGIYHYYHESEKDIEAVCMYCLDDVETEYYLSRTLMPLTETEKEVWLLDQRINEKGVYLDLPNIKNIIDTLDIHQKKLLEETQKITEGFLNSPKQVGKLKEWLENHGIVVENLQKQTVAALLETKLPEKVEKVLRIRQKLSKASTSKFNAMLARVQEDGRARSLFMYAGAGTGRWTAKAIQLQNLVRDSFKGEDLEKAYELFEQVVPEIIDLLYGDPFKSASKCLRGVIRAEPGKIFLCADFSSVEARGNGWQAGEEDLLEDFRKGICAYRKAAAATFNTTYEKILPEGDYRRNIGKVQILSLGYQGGIGAFAAMAKNYGIDLETLPEIILDSVTMDELSGKYGAEALAKRYVKKNPETMSFEAALACDVLKRRWRAANPKIVSSWRGLNDAATRAVLEPGNIFTYRKVKFYLIKDPRKNIYLICRLPSGRNLFYFEPKMKDIKNEFSETGEYRSALTCRTVDSVTKQWVRRPLYGGLLCENIVQGLCRDLLAEAMLRLDAANFDIVMHVHDEVICEVLKGSRTLKEFISIMTEVPEWARGLPVKASGWEGIRFRK